MHRFLAPLASLFVVSIALAACEKNAPAPAPLAPSTENAGVAKVDHRAADRAVLAEHRAQEIERLHAYATKGEFPFNPAMAPQPIHMFKDARGVRCAVANLIHLDGLDELVDRYAKEQNDVVVAEQTSGPLHDWVLTSGLTNEEVRHIQGVGFPGEGRLQLDEAVRKANDLAIQERLLVVEKELRADTDKSLEVAVDEYEASHLALR